MFQLSKLKLFLKEKVNDETYNNEKFGTIEKSKFETNHCKHLKELLSGK